MNTDVDIPHLFHMKTATIWQAWGGKWWIRNKSGTDSLYNMDSEITPEEALKLYRQSQKETV